MQRDGCVLYEVFGGMCMILESMLVAGIPIRRYYYSDTGLCARKIARHRIQLLMTRYPDLLPPSAVSSTFSIPQDVYRVTRAHLREMAAVSPSVPFVLSGGFPCQDMSSAGKGLGLQGARSGAFHGLLQMMYDPRDILP